MEYPCSICALECLQDTIQCSNCKNWIHSKCINMSDKDLRAWSAAHLNFLCQNCVFSGTNYDASAALARLHTALLSNRRYGVSSQAKSEAMLLKTYSVEVPQHTTETSEFEIDEEAVHVLNMFQSVMNSVYIPLRTTGDGNCMYRAVSRVLTGSEQSHVLLRLLTALEMISNKSCYDTNKKDNDFINDIRVVTSDYNKLLKDVLQENSFSEMAHMYALSAALNEPIQSYYPPQIKTELSSAFTRTIVGRSCSLDQGPKIMLMWTSMIAPISVSTFHVNHFVPLITKPQDVEQKKNDTGGIISDFDEDEYPLYPGEDSIETLDGAYGCETLEEPVTLSDISVQDFVMDSASVSDPPVFNATGCETVEEPVTSSGKSDPDLVTVSAKDSNPATFQTPECNTREEVPLSEGEGTDSSNVSDKTVSAETSNDMHGSLHSGFLDTSTVITHLLKNTPGLQHIPSGCKENVFFIIDNKVNISNRSNKKRSAFSDDRGIWNSSAGTSPKSYFLLHENGDLSAIYLRQGTFCYKKQVKKQLEYRPLQPQPEKEQIVILHRYYTTHKLDKNYKKKVTWLGEGGLESSLALVEYVGKFPGLAPHGLSQDNKTYVRRPDYVMDEIDKLTDKNLKPEEIYQTLKDKYDEITRPPIQSIYNKIHNKKVKEARANGLTVSNNISDQICHLENMVTENDTFVRSMIRTGGKSPTIVLYTDEQIADVKRICCTGQTVLGVDKTFMLCKMHVTVTCYKQMTVVRNRTGEPPLFIGPMFVHDNSDYETYSYFFHHLKLKLAGTNMAKLVIGSDDEQAMVKAITTEFYDSTHVLCTRHLQQNARQYLTDDGVALADRKVILDKIFGRDGLVNATDDICYGNQSDEIESYCANFSDKFVQYFQKRLKRTLKTKVNEPMRDGLISSDWTNNNCESINHVLKQTVDWEMKSLPEFVRLVKRRVNGQFQELRAAIPSTGHFCLAASHQHFQVSKEDWIDMTEQQRANLFKRFRQFVVKDDKIVISTDGRSAVIAPRTEGKKPGQRKRKVNIRTVTINAKKTKE